MDRAFVVMQIGAKDSLDRKRADETFQFVVAPAVEAVGLEPYRADLDPSPGAITPKILSELLAAKVVIADLTGRNPNVFYELGIAHSFARPLICLADTAASLPFDTQDQRVIEVGEYGPSGLGIAPATRARTALEEVLRIVLADGYVPPSPIQEVASNRSIDQLAPHDPVAAELAQIREMLDELRRFVRPRVHIPPWVKADTEALRAVLERYLGGLDDHDFGILITQDTSPEHDQWVTELRGRSGYRDQEIPF